MPRNKDLKRLVRARMRKTGEAYAAARAQLIAKPNDSPRGRRPAAKPLSMAPAPASPAAAPAPDPKAYAAIAGMKDEAIKAATGCTWEKWVYALDRRGAHQLSHGEIAALVKTKYKVGPWWTQMVTVGYERIKGLRARGQQRNGTYQMTRSRTFSVPVGTLFDAWASAATRRRWLDGAAVKVRTATRPKSMRLDWRDGGIVAVGFLAKGPAKSAVAIEHTKLPDQDAAERLKTWWSGRFDALGDVLSEE